MNKTVKAILIWIFILVLAVGIYTFVERGTERASTLLTLTDLMGKVDRGEVRAVTIRGSNLVGRLKDNPSTEFRAVIPPDYTTIYDRLTSKSVDVMILPPDVNPWLSAVPTTLLIGGSILWFAISVVILVLLVDLSRFVKRELARSAGRPSAS